MKIEEKDLSITIRSVDKALAMLEVFSELDGGIKLSNLSEKLNMNKSGVHRMLQAFKQRGYVEQRTRHGQYQLGASAYRVGQKIVSNALMLNIAKPFMERLAKECNETVYLALFNDAHVLLFEHVDSSNVINIKSLNGNLYPLTGCAAGQVFIAFSQILPDSCPQNADSTVPHYAEIKQKGYSLDVDLLDTGVSSLAVPLFACHGKSDGQPLFRRP